MDNFEIENCQVILFMIKLYLTNWYKLYLGMAGSGAIRKVLISAFLVWFCFAMVIYVTVVRTAIGNK
jgi:hypothetical protein